MVGLLNSQIAVATLGALSLGGLASPANAREYMQRDPITAPGTPPTTPAVPQAPGADLTKAAEHKLENIEVGGLKMAVSSRAINTNVQADRDVFNSFMSGRDLEAMLKYSEGNAVKESFPKAAADRTKENAAAVNMKFFNGGTLQVVPSLNWKSDAAFNTLCAMKDAGFTSAALVLSDKKVNGNYVYSFTADVDTDRDPATPADKFSVICVTSDLNPSDPLKFRQNADKILPALADKFGITPVASASNGVQGTIPSTSGVAPAQPIVAPAQGEGAGKTSKADERNAERAAAKAAAEAAKAAERERINPSNSSLGTLQEVAQGAYVAKYQAELSAVPPRAYQRGAFTTAGTAREKLDAQMSEVTRNLTGLDAVIQGTKADEKTLKDAMKKGINAQAQAAAVRLGMSPEAALNLKPEDLQGLVTKADELQKLAGEQVRLNKKSQSDIRSEINKLK